MSREMIFKLHTDHTHSPGTSCLLHDPEMSRDIIFHTLIILALLPLVVSYMTLK